MPTASSMGDKPGAEWLSTRWVQTLVMDNRRRRTGHQLWGIVRIQVALAVVGLALAVIAFVAVVLSR